MTVEIIDVDSRYICRTVTTDEKPEARMILKAEASCSGDEKNLILTYNLKGQEIVEEYDSKVITKPAGTLIEKIDKVNSYIESKDKMKLSVSKDTLEINSNDAFTAVSQISFPTRPAGRYSFVIYGKAKGIGDAGALLKIQVPEGAKLSARVLANKTKTSDFFNYFLNDVNSEMKERIFTADGKSLLFSITGSVIGGTDNGTVILKAKGNVIFLPGCGVTAYEF